MGLCPGAGVRNGLNLSELCPGEKIRAIDAAPSRKADVQRSQFYLLLQSGRYPDAAQVVAQMPELSVHFGFFCVARGDLQLFADAAEFRKSKRRSSSFHVVSDSTDGGKIQPVKELE